MSAPELRIEQAEAIEHLLAIAQRDTGQSKRVADFLLAWHNSAENGGWDPCDLWSLDNAIADEIVMLIAFIGSNPGMYLPNWGYEPEITAVWKRWRAPAASTSPLRGWGVQ